MINGLNLAFFNGPQSYVASHQHKFLKERGGVEALEVTVPMIALVATTVSRLLCYY